jgi:hypothetical protein
MGYSYPCKHVLYTIFSNNAIALRLLAKYLYIFFAIRTIFKEKGADPSVSPRIGFQILFCINDPDLIDHLLGTVAGSTGSGSLFSVLLRDYTAGNAMELAIIPSIVLVVALRAAFEADASVVILVCMNELIADHAVVISVFIIVILVSALFSALKAKSVFVVFVVATIVIHVFSAEHTVFGFIIFVVAFHTAHKADSALIVFVVAFNDLNVNSAVSAASVCQYITVLTL